MCWRWTRTRSRKIWPPRYHHWCRCGYWEHETLHVITYIMGLMVNNQAGQWMNVYQAPAHPSPRSDSGPAHPATAIAGRHDLTRCRPLIGQAKPWSPLSLAVGLSANLGRIRAILRSSSVNLGPVFRLLFCQSFRITSYHFCIYGLSC